ncbi:uncharacterized protein LOC122970051 [Thunnus albacares]|uniref:uncharacterized protein LOC122970051 n=1 Tax=Thunnus albacares TaxID=8236 RepID=UPI001CF691FD|nr:uncharacterized protein LOC122970051 [Thunnus albacares]
MLRFMIFCHVWFLQTRLIRCNENFTGLQVGSFSSAGHLSPPAGTRFSVPEDLQLCLLCGSSDGSDVAWSQDSKDLVTRHGNYENNRDRRHYLLLSGGGLCLLRLDDSDSGEYRCNQQLVAELQVLTGQDFRVSEGRTLLLPCSGSTRPKQRWIHRRVGGKREAILTRYRNGTVKAEREESRYSMWNDALQILDLQPDDAGEYLCNGELQARVTVLKVNPETTRMRSATSTTPTPADMISDVVDIKRKEKKRPENALLMVVVTSLGLMILLMVAVCVLLTSMKCRRKRKYRRAAAAAAQNHEDTELQPWMTSNSQTECDKFESPSPAEETIHYASLGRQNWRERPSRSPQHQNHHNVIYSSVITRPAANSKQKHTQTQTGMKYYI